MKTDLDSKENEKHQSSLEKKLLPYHEEANFMVVYATIDGYAVVDGGKKSGYLIRAGIL